MLTRTLTRRFLLAHVAACLIACSCLLGAPAHAQQAWLVGVAKVDITPPSPMPMAGYAARGAQHADGKLHSLWAKVLMLEDPSGHRGVLVTMDLCGIGRDLSQRMCERIAEIAAVERDQILLSLSHTHSGPVVGENLQPMHLLRFEPQDQQLVADYADFLVESVLEAVRQASTARAPARMAHGSGWATFAVNRRNNPHMEVPARRSSGSLVGPVDYSVPVLAIYREETLIACTFGYACHCTTLDGLQWSGDYAGFAQEMLEAEHPGCIAMFWAGCGADQNPLPRRTVELAQAYGQQLAGAVEDVLSGVLVDLEPSLKTRYSEVELEFESLPTKEQLVLEAESENVYYATRAEMLLQRLEAGQHLAANYPYPIASWRLGNSLDWVALGGEVVVDYALATRALRDDSAIWMMGYANDVMAYIPSRRVLAEGGYEGGGAMVYYGLPSAWAPTIERTILQEVSRQLDD